MDAQERSMNVPYIVHEGIVARWERTNRRLVYALIMTILLVFASNALWLWAWIQYDYASEDATTTTTTTVTRTVDIDGKDGIASYINGSGNVINGKGRSHDNGDEDNKNETKEEAEIEEWE